MREREKASRRTEGQPTTGHSLNASSARDAGLAVEGPGFLVWDEVASDARRRAGELRAVAPWRIRSAAPRR